MPRPVNLAERREDVFISAVAGPRKACSGTTTSTWLYTATGSGMLGALRVGGRNFEKWADVGVREAHCLAASEDLVAVGGTDGVVRLFAARTLVPKVSWAEPGYSATASRGVRGRHGCPRETWMTMLHASCRMGLVTQTLLQSVVQPLA